MGRLTGAAGAKDAEGVWLLAVVVAVIAVGDLQ
jgi:hypothetical protein